MARYGNIPLTSPMAVSETLARTMIQNASRSMAGDFCEDKQRHSRTGPQTAFAARSITVLANRYRLNLMRESQSSQRCGSNIKMVWHFCRGTVVISAVAENDARYVVPSGGVANGGPERWNSTHMCRCSSPLARPATALMAWRPATARRASPSRRVRAQWQR